jgi:hypothetical protein
VSHSVQTPGDLVREKVAELVIANTGLSIGIQVELVATCGGQVCSSNRSNSTSKGMAGNDQLVVRQLLYCLIDGSKDIRSDQVPGFVEATVNHCTFGNTTSVCEEVKIGIPVRIGEGSASSEDDLLAGRFRCRQVPCNVGFAAIGRHAG